MKTLEKIERYVQRNRVTTRGGNGGQIMGVRDWLLTGANLPKTLPKWFDLDVRAFPGNAKFVSEDSVRLVTVLDDETIHHKEEKIL